MKYCKYCGSQLDDDAAVCTKCGKVLGDQQGQTVIIQQVEKQEQRKNGCGVAGFVFGLLGIILSWISSVFLWWLAIPFAAIGFVLSLIGVIVGKAKKQSIGLGVAGLILSLISIVIVLLVVFVLGSLMSSLM